MAAAEGSAEVPEEPSASASADASGSAQADEAAVLAAAKEEKKRKARELLKLRQAVKLTAEDVEEPPHSVQLLKVVLLTTVALEGFVLFFSYMVWDPWNPGVGADHLHALLGVQPRRNVRMLKLVVDNIMPFLLLQLFAAMTLSKVTGSWLGRVQKEKAAYLIPAAPESAEGEAGAGAPAGDVGAGAGDAGAPEQH
eukprot:TRINITY_DN23254_c0_g5_i1.p1 TRINITY_DN23254_c0_g5~~TRINITY_DN23254_c0_g5_i1.p1  ORF type:complete len:196 (-),score=45.33 TRINITY_DN23254_c0_g5_i1:353-940(-)